jgi:hypothetical protein
MMIGNPGIFAIESEISRAYERLGLRALGFFVLHVGGRRYGVYEPEATMLANSFDDVQERIASAARTPRHSDLNRMVWQSPMPFEMPYTPINRKKAFSVSP